MCRILFILLVCCLPIGLWADEYYCFRVYLKDKGNAGYRVENPEVYLSKRAIERRIKQAIEVTQEDFPISPAYINQLSKTGAKPIVQSRWFATVVMESTDSLVAKQLEQLDIVDSVKYVWKGKRENLERVEETGKLYPEKEPLPDKYGHAQKQIKMLNGMKLHKAGFQGEGMQVAVIDAGFKHVDRIAAFDSLHLLGTYNFVTPGESVFLDDDHGTKVLSCLAANLPGIMVGTAPNASFLLLKSEDGASEYPIEEDYWTAAVEYADSVGVDVVTSSLGYFSFDDESLSYGYEALTGKHALISQAANRASEKGILVFCSAGNEGGNEWRKITVPADAIGAFTVGSITQEKKRSNFSSMGFTADRRVKPDAVALGTSSCVIGSRGDVRFASGTSFSTPILAGLGICLWQSLPGLTNREVMDLLRRSSHLYKRPNVELGYGIPNVYKAYKKGKKYESRSK
ncbi:MAG: S8 family serine peptidase [Parabacteroides sp.]|nr:S8 family serine peptidase [Parabacteroides sp.]